MPFLASSGNILVKLCILGNEVFTVIAVRITGLFFSHMTYAFGALLPALIQDKSTLYFLNSCYFS